MNRVGRCRESDSCTEEKREVALARLIGEQTNRLSVGHGHWSQLVCRPIRDGRGIGLVRLRTAAPFKFCVYQQH